MKGEVAITLMMICSLSMRSSHHRLRKLIYLFLRLKKFIRRVINYSDNIFIEIIQEDRSIAIEAAIVRIMKSRKRSEHNMLV